MTKYLENLIIDLLRIDNKYSINENTRFCLCKLLESLGYTHNNISIGFIENIYKDCSLIELSDIFFYNTKYNFEYGLISILGVCEQHNDFLNSRFNKIKKEFKINHDINCKKKKFNFNILSNIKPKEISLNLIKFFITDYLLNPFNYSIKDCTKNDLMLLINNIDLENCDNIDIILFSEIPKKGLINILENYESDNIELNKLFKSIKNYCNNNNKFYLKNNNNNIVVSSRLKYIL